MLTKYEQETTINFNKEEKMAHIFTYEKTLQQHLEGKLRLKPTLTNGFGGKGYEIDKKRIPKPRSPRKLSSKTRQALGNATFGRKTKVISTKSDDEKEE